MSPKTARPVVLFQEGHYLLFGRCHCYLLRIARDDSGNISNHAIAASDSVLRRIPFDRHGKRGQRCSDHKTDFWMRHDTSFVQM